MFKSACPIKTRMTSASEIRPSLKSYSVSRGVFGEAKSIWMLSGT